MLTGYGNIPTAVAAIKQGAIDYLAKPADADDVEKALLADPNKKASPPENPMSADRVKWEHIHKYMGAPHSTGIALGTKDVIDTIARHSFVGYESRRIRGIGRPHKIDRQEIIGVYAAVKRWMSLNHEERLSYEESKTLNIVNDIKDIDGLEVKIIDNIIGHQPFGLNIDIDSKKIKSNNLDFVDVLKNSEPSIWTRVPDGKDTIEIHVFGMTLDQSKIVGKVIKEKLEGLMI